MFVRRHGVDTRDRAAVFAPEELNERRVDERLLVARLEANVGERLAHEAHGEEDERRAAGPVGALRRRPGEETEGEEERVDAGFLEVGLREAEEVLHALLRLLGRQPGDEKGLGEVAAGEGEGSARGELVLEPAEVAAAEGDELFGLAGVQEAVAEREV